MNDTIVHVESSEAIAVAERSVESLYLWMNPTAKDAAGIAGALSTTLRRVAVSPISERRAE